MIRSSLTIVLLACSFTKLSADTILNAYAGSGWGSWGPWDECDSGKYARCIDVKIERPCSETHKCNNGDDTALNSVKLRCQTPNKDRAEHYITSKQGYWGNWQQDLGRGSKCCPIGEFITGYKYRGEGHQGSGDDTAGNGVKVRCSGGTELSPGNGYWGTWSGWKECPSGQYVAGLRTRVESQQGGGDDTALGGLMMKCKPAPRSTWRVPGSCGTGRHLELVPTFEIKDECSDQSFGHDLPKCVSDMDVACGELCTAKDDKHACGTERTNGNCGEFVCYSNNCEDGYHWRGVQWEDPAAVYRVMCDQEDVDKSMPCGVGYLKALPDGSSECPPGDMPHCDTVACGELCEGDGECGTDGGLNNCGGYDIYRMICEEQRSYNVVAGKHCGGTTISNWNDGTSAQYGRTDLSVNQCKAECDSHHECAAFVLRDSDYGCFWKSGSLNPHNMNGHHCFIPGGSGTATVCSLKVSITSKSWGSEIRWRAGGNGKLQSGYSNSRLDVKRTVVVPAGRTTLEFWDTYGDGWHGGSWTVFDSNNVLLATGGCAGCSQTKRDKYVYNCNSTGRRILENDIVGSETKRQHNEGEDEDVFVTPRRLEEVTDSTSQLATRLAESQEKY